MKKTENMFGFGGSFVGTVEKIFDIMALGFLWILCSLPVITIGASTTALYYAMVKSVKNNDGYVTKEFFRSFKLNFYSSHNFMDDSCSDDIYHAVKCRNLNEEKQWHGGSVFYLLLCTGIGLSDYCGMLCISGTFQI